MTTVTGHMAGRWVSCLVLVGLTAVTAACGGGQPAGCPSPEPLTGDDATGVPPDLDLTGFGVLTRVDVDGGFVSYRVESAKSVQDLFVPVTRALRRDGWSLVGSENEGVDAEVYFARGQSETGVVVLDDLGCDGAVAIEVTVSGPVG